MKHENAVLKAVMQTEKGAALQEKQNRYMVRVDRAATKPEIKKAVEDFFNVTVTAVNVQNYGGKKRTLRNRYRLPRRVSPAALLFVPWIDVLLVVGAACLFHSATCGVPAETFRLDGVEAPSVSLPDAPFASAARSSLVLVVRRLPPDALAGAPLAPECLPAQAFLDNVAWNLSRPDRAAAFPEAVAAAAKASAERSALVYMDADLSHRDALRLAAMLRAAGLESVAFATRPDAPAPSRP